MVRVEFNPAGHLVPDPGCEPTAHHQVRRAQAHLLPVEVILLASNTSTSERTSLKAAARAWRYD